MAGCLAYAAREPSCGKRSITSCTRWKRSSSFNTNMFERRCGRALFLVATHVEGLVIRAAVGEPMMSTDSVKGEYNGFVPR